MGTTQSSDLNQDAGGKFTSGNYGNLGDGSIDWFMYVRMKNGADPATGATTDASTPTGNGSLIALTKALRDMFKYEDAAHVSGDAGLQALSVRNDGLGSLTSGSGDYSPTSVGSVGENFATFAPPMITASAAAVALSEAATTALATNLVVKASAGTLYRLHGINNNAAVRYIQIANLAALGADGTVPAFVWQVAASSPFSIDFGMFGRRFTTGIVVCISTTLATKTIGAADLWVNASYK